MNSLPCLFKICDLFRNLSLLFRIVSFKNCFIALLTGDRVNIEVYRSRFTIICQKV